MILYDFSSLIHRSIFTAIKNTNPHKKDKKYITSEYINLCIHKILTELLEVYRFYNSEYKDLVICLDDHSRAYWRKELYPEYKEQRKAIREESEVNYQEVFKHLDVLVKVINDYTPFKSFAVPGAEADDLIAVLTKRYAPFEKILIHSPDKDMIQLHHFGDVKQYSAITNKFITEEDKGEHWELCHICLGDVSDNVPKITDNTIFSKNFKEYLKSKNINISELEYYHLKDKSIFSDYNKLNKKNELDIFDNPRFGEATLLKKIKEFGSLDKFLDSNPLYRLQYNRNKVLVLEGGIPAKIETDIIREYNDSATVFNLEKLELYLKHYELNTLIIEFKNLSSQKSDIIPLTAENCGWI